MITKLRVFIIDHCEIMFVMFIEKKNFCIHEAVTYKTLGMEIM